MSLDPLIQKLESFRNELPSIIERLAQGIANDAASIIVNRTQIQGKNAARQSLTSSGGPYTVQYAKFRKKKGRQTTFLDLTFTGEMLQSISLKSKSISQNKFSIKIAPSDTRRSGSGNFNNAEIMEVHEERFGEIMALSDEELKVLEGNIVSIIQRKLEETLR